MCSVTLVFACTVTYIYTWVQRALISMLILWGLSSLPCLFRCMLICSQRLTCCLLHNPCTQTFPQIYWIIWLHSTLRYVIAWCWTGPIYFLILLFVHEHFHWNVECSICVLRCNVVKAGIYRWHVATMYAKHIYVVYLTNTSIMQKEPEHWLTDRLTDRLTNERSKLVNMCCVGWGTHKGGVWLQSVGI